MTADFMEFVPQLVRRALRSTTKISRQRENLTSTNPHDGELVRKKAIVINLEQRINYVLSKSREA